MLRVPVEQPFAGRKLEKLRLPAVDFQRPLERVFKQQARVCNVVADSYAQHGHRLPVKSFCAYFTTARARRKTKLDICATNFDIARACAAKNDNYDARFDSTASSLRQKMVSLNHGKQPRSIIKRRQRPC